MDRKERLNLLARKNAGRLLIPEFAGRLSRVLGRPIADADFLPLPTSDTIRSRFGVRDEAASDGALTLRSGWHEPDEMERALAPLGARLGRVLLFFDVSDRTGALPIEADEAFSNASALLGLSGGGMVAADASGANSLSLGYDDDWYANWGVRPYEALVEGPSWVVEASPFLRAV